MPSTNDDIPNEFFSASVARSVRAPIPLLPQCGKCGLNKTCQSPKMPVDGRGEKKILIIGERPGQAEDREGRPLVGNTGQRLAEMLDECSIDMRRDCWLYNAIICTPKPKTEVPSATIEHCRPNVIRTIKELNPEVIILLGGDAVRSVIGWLWKPDTGPISRWVGWQIPSIQLNAWITPTYQPAQLFHDPVDPVLEMDLQDHLRSAVELAGTRPHPDGPPNYESRIECIHSAEEAARRIRNYTSGMIAFDYETTKIKPDSKDAEIVACSVCWNGEETIAFPWYGAVKSAMRELLENPDIGKIFYNAKFELRWTLAKLGIAVKGVAWDGMLAAHCLDPRGGKEGKGGGVTGLKFQSFCLLGVGDYSYRMDSFLRSKEKGGNAPNNIRQAKLDDILLYVGMDSLLEWEVAQKQMRIIGW